MHAHHRVDLLHLAICTGTIAAITKVDLASTPVDRSVDLTYLMIYRDNLIDHKS